MGNYDTDSFFQKMVLSLSIAHSLLPLAYLSLDVIKITLLKMKEIKYVI